MSSYNKVILVGNVTRDVAVKTIPSGQKVAEIGLAINRSYTQDGVKKEEVTFVDISFWGRQAEVLEQYLQKGASVLVEGRLKLNSWTDQDGNKKQKLSIIGESFQFLGGKKAGDDTMKRTPLHSSLPNEDEINDDEIPF